MESESPISLSLPLLIDSSRCSAVNVTYFRGKARKGYQEDIHSGLVAKNWFRNTAKIILSIHAADNKGRLGGSERIRT